MGDMRPKPVDLKEFDSLAKLIRWNFPKKEFPRVVDIAGGRGYMATRLARAGYDVTLIDPESNLEHPKVKVLKRRFFVQDADGFDFLVALAPCAASQKAVRAAKRKPIIFAPCRCRWVWPGSRAPSTEAAAFFKKMKVPVRRDGNLFWTLTDNLRVVAG